MDDDYSFEAEYDVLQRGGFLERDVLGELFGTERKRVRDIRDITQRFYVQVDAVARVLIEQKIISITRRDIPKMLDYIGRVPYIKYKNPTAFVLGYDVTLSGYIDMRKLDKLKSKLKDITTPVRLEDIIRYSNLWLRIR